MPSRRAVAVAAALTTLALAGWWLRIRVPGFESFEGEAMATRWRIVLPDRPGSAAHAAACFELYRQLDQDLSEWKQGSPLSAVNRAAGVEPVEVPQDLFDLTARAMQIGAATDGAFDISWAALWGLWDFRAVPPRLPDAAAIAERRRLVDFTRIQLDHTRRTIYLPVAGMKVGLGGIGKGYALARAAAWLEARGERDFLLLGGGQVLARGHHRDRPWRIGIRDPRGAPEDWFARLELDDESLSTSADDESYFEIDGVRYHHILDPRTGWPARGLRSATVLHRDPVLADALSTALMVLGEKRGLEVVAELGGEAVLVDDAGRMATTPGLGARLHLLHPPRG